MFTLKRTIRFHFVMLFMAAAFSAPRLQAANNPSFNENYQQDLITHFTKKGFDIKPFFEDSRFKLYEGITKKFTGSPEKVKPTLEQYKKAVGYNGKKERIPQFIKQYQADLDKAEKEYGISKSVIVGILGIESNYGSNAGTYNPFNAYVSMFAENYRVPFALEQLEDLLKFAGRNNLDIFEMKSSYAGAMSYAQFIPTSLNRWFVGTELYNMSNNIYSVANYLAHFKKITGTIEKAVFRYNPSDLYVGVVMALAEDAEVILASNGS